MSLFDNQPDNFNKYIVISASRMSDMPRFYPKELIDGVIARQKKGLLIHTLVLWTKHPKSLLKEPLFPFLLELKKQRVQIYLQLTITGMGQMVVGKQRGGNNIFFEPNVPKYQDSFETLPQIINLLEKPERIRLRIDPIVRIVDISNNIFSNISLFPIIVGQCVKYGIKNFSFSFLEDNAHRKVNKRMNELECKIISPDKEEREKVKIWIEELSKKYSVNINNCCIPGLPMSSCIDGRLLQELDDYHRPLDLSRPKKRELCGCTESIDIGGWPPKLCFSGCEYCYANPKYFRSHPRNEDIFQQY